MQLYSFILLNYSLEMFGQFLVKSVNLKFSTLRIMESQNWCFSQKPLLYTSKPLARFRAYGSLTSHNQRPGDLGTETSHGIHWSFTMIPPGANRPNRNLSESWSFTHVFCLTEQSMVCRKNGYNDSWCVNMIQITIYIYILFLISPSNDFYSKKMRYIFRFWNDRRGWQTKATQRGLYWFPVGWLPVTLCSLGLPSPRP